MRIYKLIILVILLLPVKDLSAQISDRNNSDLERMYATNNQVIEIFSKQNLNLIPAGVAIYPFMIKVYIEKDKNNKVVVKDIQTNDSTAFKIFPNYNKLREVNFEHFLKYKDRLEYRIPILIHCEEPKPGQRSRFEGSDTPYINLISVVKEIQKMYDYDEHKSINDINYVFQQPLQHIWVVRIR